MKKIYTKEILQPIVNESVSFSEVFRKLNPGRKVHGGSIDWIKRKLKQLSIDHSHFQGRAWMKGRAQITSRAMKKEEFEGKFLKEDSNIITHRLKQRLVKFGMKEDKCEKCGNEGKWNGEKLTLQIDHINGRRDDNRLENLRILCPNCHSQTKTYSGKKNKKEDYPDKLSGLPC